MLQTQDAPSTSLPVYLAHEQAISNTPMEGLWISEIPIVFITPIIVGPLDYFMYKALQGGLVFLSIKHVFSFFLHFLGKVQKSEKKTTHVAIPFIGFLVDPVPLYENWPSLSIARKQWMPAL